MRFRLNERASRLIVGAALCALGCANDPAPSKAPPTPGANVSVPLSCDVAVWLDLAAARKLPKLERLRGLVLAKAAQTSAAGNLAQAEVERDAESAMLCMNTRVRPPQRVIRLEGRFSDNVLEQLARAAPAATTP